MVDLPVNCEAIGCKWVLKEKFNAHGSLGNYKAWLVFKGLTQVVGIDCGEIVVDFATSLTWRTC